MTSAMRILPSLHARLGRAIPAVAMVGLLVGVGCTPSADGQGPIDKTARRAATRQKMGSSQRAAANARNRAASVFAGGRHGNDTLPLTFVPQYGYMIRGTDELVFRPCADTNSYFMIAGPGVGAQLGQMYRFSASKMYSPVYVHLQTSLSEDTITVGYNHYTRIARVKAMLLLQDDEVKKCKPPRRGSTVQPAFDDR
jgi:hypothetical protein